MTYIKYRILLTCKRQKAEKTIDYRTGDIQTKQAVRSGTNRAHSGVRGARKYRWRNDIVDSLEKMAQIIPGT